MSIMKYGKRKFLFCFLAVFSFLNINNLHAEDYFWVAGSGSWSELNHWATSSGGSVFHSTVPGFEDHVIFDQNSFSELNNSISGNRINKIHIDNEDRLWLISEYRGLDKINLITGQISNYVFENDTNFGFQNSDFKDIISDNSGILWILGKKKGLKSFDKKKETFQTYTDVSIYPNNRYYDEGLSLEVDGDILWIGTSEKDFVEKNQGEIWVTSEIGKGSTFYFNLAIK